MLQKDRMTVFSFLVNTLLSCKSLLGCGVRSFDFGGTERLNDSIPLFCRCFTYMLVVARGGVRREICEP